MIDSWGTRLAPLAWLAPCVVAVLAHEPALDGDFVNWDDPQYLLSNPMTEAPLERGVGALLLSRPISYPVPVTVLGYAAQRRAFASDAPEHRFGLDPGGFHAVSLGLHAAVALLVALLAGGLGAGRAGALLAACAFAAHPLAVEPVAWVVGQKDLLAALFALLALLVRAGPRGDAPARSLAVIALAALAMGSKPSAVSVPALLLGIDLLRGRRVLAPRSLALYAALGGLALFDIYLALSGHEADGVSPTGAFGLASLSQAAWSYALQVGHLAWPGSLGARYFSPAGPAFAVWAALGALLAALTVALTWLACRRGARAVAFGTGSALVAYLPVAGILPLPRGPADVYVYLPLALAATALAHGLGRLWARPSHRLPTAAAAGLVIALSAVAARAQATVWRDSVTLWTQVALTFPDEPRAVVRLADGLLFEGRTAEAVAAYEQLERRFPAFALHYPGFGDALVLVGRPADAERAYAAAAREQLRDAAETYALFLAGTPRVTPSDDATAREALVATAPLLAARGKRVDSLERAASLLDAYGEPGPAASLRERAAALRTR